MSALGINLIRVKKSCFLQLFMCLIILMGWLYGIYILYLKSGLMPVSFSLLFFFFFFCFLFLFCFVLFVVVFFIESERI